MNKLWPILILTAISLGWAMGASTREAEPDHCILCGDRNPTQYIVVPMCQPCVGHYTNTEATK